MPRKMARLLTGKNHKKTTGDYAEMFAKQYLVKQGLRYIESNFLCRGGEIDLIFFDGITIIFVEVRYRINNSHGGAAESITPKKQARLIKAAQYWLKKNNKHLVPARFDAILFEGKIDQDHLLWLKAIF